MRVTKTTTRATILALALIPIMSFAQPIKYDPPGTRYEITLDTADRIDLKISNRPDSSGIHEKTIPTSSGPIVVKHEVVIGWKEGGTLNPDKYEIQSWPEDFCPRELFSKIQEHESHTFIFDKCNIS